MFHHRQIIIGWCGVCLLLAAAGFARGQQEPPAAGDEATLIAVLQSDAPLFDKAKACQQLAVIGTEKAVPALAELLSDEQLSHYARFGLEPIPVPAVDAVLRDALSRLRGGLLVGVINSIGVRRDTAAVEPVAELLASSDAEVAAAAAAALGRIASPESIAILNDALALDAPLRQAVAAACLTAADILEAEGNTAAALDIFDTMRQADLPKHQRIGAVAGAIRVRGPEGVDLLIEQLRSDDEDLFAVGLSMAHLIPGSEVTEALIARLSESPVDPPEEAKLLVITKAEYGAQDKWVDVTDVVSAAADEGGLSIQAGNHLAGDPADGIVKSLRVAYTLDGKANSVEAREGEQLTIEGHAASNPRQASIIAVLGKRGDVAALPVVLRAAQEGSWDVRLPAIRVLAALGDASVVPLLLDHAASGQGALASAALDSLADLRAESVDDTLADMLEESTGPERLVLIELMGRREIAASVPTLFALAEGGDSAVRLAAIDALGLTVGQDDLGALLQQLTAAREPDVAKVAKVALERACQRMPDRNAAAQLLIDRIPSASPQLKADLLDLLRAVGGERALQGVVEAARSSDEQLQDAATRVLGEWMSADAAPALLELAKTGNPKFRVRTLRGYLRIARQLDVPTAERIAMCATALKTAERNEERNLAIETLGRYPALEALDIVEPALEQPALRQAAAKSAVAIGSKLVDSQPARVARAMKKVLAATDDPDVIASAKQLLSQAEPR
jgi:HEAT repeat protein